MNAGKLKHLVTIEKPINVQDPATGALTVSWQKVRDVRARVEPSSAREFIASRAGQSEITGKITMRYRSDIDATMRVVHRGRIYNIEGVLEDNQSGLEWMTLPVIQGVNTGEI